MRMEPGKWLKIWALITAGILAFIVGTVYQIDPFFHYHKPYTDRYYYVLDNQRSQNDGIVRFFDYDAIITGTSLIDNFKTSEAEELFHAGFIKIPSDGGSYKEINDMVVKAASANPDLRIVIRGLDMAGFWTSKDEMREDLGTYPTYLYDGNDFNDVKYIFNKDIFPGRVCRMIAGRISKSFKPGITSFDDYSAWQAENGYGFWAVCPDGISTEAAEEIFVLTEDEKKQISDSIEQNVISAAQQNPDIEFYYFYPPYSIVWWNELNRTGRLDKQLEAEQMVTEMLLPYENIHLYSFNDRTDIIYNLDNYKDSLHYGPWINTEILKCIHDGKGLLTKENCEDYFINEQEILKNYDYSSISP